MELNENSLNSRSDEIVVKDVIVKISDWSKYLLSKWVLLISLSIVGGIIGMTYAYLKKPIYEANTTFVLEEAEKGGGLGAYAGLASMAGIDLGGSGGGIFEGDNILELYKSRKMIQKTLLTKVNQFGKEELLIDSYIEFNNLRQKWSKNKKLVNLKFYDVKLPMPEPLDNRLRDSIIGRIVQDINKNYLTVLKPDKKLSIIEVTVKSTDEFFAKAFNDAIVSNVNDFYVKTKTQRSMDNVKILQQKTDSVRLVMNGSIYKAAEITDATPNLNPSRLVQRMAPVQKSQFSVETNKALLSELVKNLELGKISLRKEAPLIQVVDQPIFPLDKIELGKVKGAALGVALVGLMSTLFLLFKKIISDIIKN